jgi:ribosomal-protein-alanine N-acetyltransferase
MPKPNNMLLFRTLLSEEAEPTFQIYKRIIELNSQPIGGNWEFHQFKEEVHQQKVLGAFNNLNEILGFLVFSQLQAGEYDILLLGVSPDYLRQKIMTRLFTHFIDHYSAKKCYVEVHEKNLAALNLYLSLNFNKVGVRKNFYGQGESAYLLALEP